MSIIPSFKSDEAVYYTEEISTLKQSSQSVQSSHLSQTSQQSEVVSTTQFSVNSDTLEPVDSKPLTFFSYVWGAGAVIMASYGIFLYIRLKFRFRDAVLYSENIRQSEKVTSPFVLGIFRPQIYIPFDLDNKTRKQVILHEQSHIKRLDHIWKPLGFALLCLHWFNPLMWVSYMLFCRDVEVACDEKVIRKYSLKMKKKYAMALLECRNSKGSLFATPLAFGEIGVDVRIKNTIKYKRPTVAVVVFGIVLTIVLSACLLTNPISAVSNELTEQATVSDDKIEDNNISVVPVDTTVPATEVPSEPPSQPATESATEPATEPMTEPTTEPEIIPTEPSPEPYVEDSFTEDSYYEESYDYDNENSFEFVEYTIGKFSTPLARKGDNYSLLDGVVNNPYANGIDPTKPIKIFETNNFVIAGSEWSPYRNN